MSCCNGNLATQNALDQVSAQAKESELDYFCKKLSDGTKQLVVSSPSIHCGACISILEKELGALDGVKDVRVNLTLKRAQITLADQDAPCLPIIERARELGYDTVPIDLGEGQNDSGASDNGRMLKALAVAAFGAMNIMLLSVSTWSGAEGSTKNLFHLISALIAIPTVLYAGRIFFSSAYKALRAGHLNMDVPISLAVILALSMSVFETFTGGDIVYFDASVSLLFFLLIGRYLDQMMRRKARNSVNALARRHVKGATQILSDGTRNYHPIDEIKVGMVIEVLPGESIPVDGSVTFGSSDIDVSLINGEDIPASVSHGAKVSAGSQNLTGPLHIQVEKSADESFLAQMGKMLDAAENGRGAYVRIADRMAKIYAPAVHALALFGFIGWMFYTGGDWHTSIYVAISILIITCPCALGLAVPVVHVIAAGRLFDLGILMKDGSGLERLCNIDHVIFDKTGTLTTEQLAISDISLADDSNAALIYALAKNSNHPVSKALAKRLSTSKQVLLEDISEEPGCGLEAKYKGSIIRLGSHRWVSEVSPRLAEQKPVADLYFAIDNEAPSHFQISAKVRDDAKSTIDALKKLNIPIEILSGDREQNVAAMGARLSLPYTAEVSPIQKLEHVNMLADQGSKVLMVGDGINDAPSLAAGYASMAPATASDVGRAAADFVFTRNELSAILHALKIAKKADQLVKQNFALALIYNMIAIPLAFMGFVTPLFAAIAMSASSIVVILNSMRLADLGLTVDKPEGKTVNIEATA